MGKSIVREVAAEIFGEEYAKEMIRSLDIIGDIVIVKIPEPMLDKRREFGEKLLERMSYIRVVLRQLTPVEGVYRTRLLEHIAGEDRKWTIYREHGIRIKVDVEKIYFSPRLSTERLRITNLVERGERLLNMFAGCGPYTILIAKHKDIEVIHSIDINPVAIAYHLENIFLNKVKERVILYRGDSGEIVERYISGEVDRVLMPLPELAITYLKYALRALDEKGWIHIYLHTPYNRNWREALEKSVNMVKGKMPENWRIKEIEGHKVREVGTRLLQVCVDTYVVKK
jgi:tRNA (guanine37-N1)-methyltransferase